MKYLMFVLAACGSPLPQTETAQTSARLDAQHTHVVKHNMVLFGASEVFASHIVYKQPHNYQVILQLRLDDETQAKYIEARAANHDSMFIYLLDDMHIADIAALDSIRGTIFFRDAEGTKRIVARDVTLDKTAFRIVYFEELPLSLAAE